MSDDGYYADSPYDEFEEMLWDADPGPNLADDLAQHTAYSPVWQDDPIGELDQYHSDWEYYSDDYFDDDPAILKKNPLDGGPAQMKGTGESQSRRGRKRKVDEAFDGFERLESKSLISSIQGTVWAKNTTPSMRIFRDGQDEKVALLTDWRERFQTIAKRQASSSRRNLERDESWANELSLADMGLKGVRGREGTQQDASPGNDDSDEEIGTDIEGSVADVGLLTTDVNHDAEEDNDNFSQQSTHDTELGTENDSPDSKLEDVQFDDHSKAYDPRARKRLKVADKPLRSRSPNQEGTKKSRRLPNGSSGSQGYAQSSKQLKAASVQSSRSKSPAKQLVGLEPRKSASEIADKKRKFSVSSEEDSSITASSASHRAKRAASSKLGGIQPYTTMEEPPSAGTRSAKARKD